MSPQNNSLFSPVGQVSRQVVSSLSTINKGIGRSDSTKKSQGSDSDGQTPVNI